MGRPVVLRTLSDKRVFAFHELLEIVVQKRENSASVPQDLQIHLLESPVVVRPFADPQVTETDINDSSPEAAPYRQSC